MPDAEDDCPDKLGDHTDDPKTNGCPKPRIVDSDGDGVRDEIDACPDVKGDATDDPKTNGCPPKLPDADQDGVPDKDDACPHDAGNATSDPKTNGCPPRAAFRCRRPNRRGRRQLPARQPSPSPASRPSTTEARASTFS